MMFAKDLPESVIKTLSIKVKASGGINLGQGIPSFSTPIHIRLAAKKALNEKDIGVYPNFLGTIELRGAIADKLNKEYKTHIAKEEHILITVGAMEAVAASVLSIIGTGDSVGIVTPDYCNHFPVVMLGRGKIIEIPMQETTKWSLDLDQIETAAKRGLKLVIITNPNNPTGAVYRHEEIEKLVALSHKYGFWLLSDETYSFLDYSGQFSSLMEFWDENAKIIVVRSFSKEYAMTGWRVGYLVTNTSSRKIIAKTHDALVGCVPKLSQRAAYSAISGSQTVVSEFFQELRKRRDLICGLLDEVNDYLTYIRPEGAYYIFPRYTDSQNSMALSESILTKANVAVVPGSVFGKAGEKHLRISFAVEEDKLKAGIIMIKDFFENKYRK